MIAKAAGQPDSIRATATCLRPTCLRPAEPRKLCARRVPLAACVLLIAVGGCGSADEPTAVRKHSGDNSVIWVVDGGRVIRQSNPVFVHNFVLEIDESQPFSYDLFPTVLMTERTHQIVVHRGGLMGILTRPKINDGERCFQVYVCRNRSCPRSKEGGDLALFPHNYIERPEPKCPYCKSSSNLRLYKTRQFVQMERKLFRQFQQNRNGS